jgi:hypothetical protein
MSSDQQKMYDHASNLVKLLSPDTKEDPIPHIGEIVVGGLSLECSVII